MISKGTATIVLTKSPEHGWIIDDFGDNTELLNALTGGLMDSIKEMEKNLGL